MSVEDIIDIIEIMTLNDHQEQYNRGLIHRKTEIIGLDTNYEIMVHNKFLIQAPRELTMHTSKLP